MDDVIIILVGYNYNVGAMNLNNCDYHALYEICIVCSITLIMSEYALQ